MREATLAKDMENPKKEISIHASREGGDRQRCATDIWSLISIHASREGGDAALPPVEPEAEDFNPRLP